MLQLIYALFSLHLVHAKITVVTLVDNLEKDGWYSGNDRAQSLLQRLKVATDSISTDDLPDIVTSWLFQPKPPLSLDACKDQLFFPVRDYESESVMRCFCRARCLMPDTEIQIEISLSLRIARKMIVDGFYNQPIGNYHDKDDVALKQKPLDNGTNCAGDGGRCCYLFYSIRWLHGIPELYVDAEERNLPVFNNDSLAEISSFNLTQYHRWRSRLRCLLEVLAGNSLEAVKKDECAVTRVRFHDSPTDGECLQRQLIEEELRYHLSYNELSILELVHFLHNSHRRVCEGVTLCPNATSNHPNVVLGNLSVFTQLLLLPIDTIILLANGLLFMVMYKGTVRVTAKQQRPLVFLSNAALANTIFAIVDIVSVGWFLTDKGIKDDVDYDKPYLKNLRTLYCCHGDLSLEGTWTLTSRITPSYHVYCASIMVSLRMICQSVSLQTFVAFGLFQIVPLLRPLKDYALLRHPRRVTTGLWVVSAVMCSLVSGINTVTYMEQKKVLKTASLNIDPETNLLRVGDFLSTPKSGEKLNWVKAANITELSFSFFMLLIGEIASGALVIFVIYLRRRRRKIRSTIGRSERTLKTLVTIGIAQTTLFISCLPMSLLAYMVEVAAGSVRTTSDKIAYHDDALFYIRFYFIARIVLLLEPLLSPILILIRYEYLATACARDLKWFKNTVIPSYSFSSVSSTTATIGSARSRFYISSIVSEETGECDLNSSSTEQTANGEMNIATITRC